MGPCLVTTQSAGNERPNYVYGAALAPPDGSIPAEWVTGCIFHAASGTFGNLGHNAFRAPAVSEVELALAKDVSIAERMKVRLRADVFNVLNRASVWRSQRRLFSDQLRHNYHHDQQLCDGARHTREFQLSAKISF